METQIKQALARGYCHPDNSHKELDARLIDAMAKELMRTIWNDAESSARHYQRQK